MPKVTKNKKKKFPKKLQPVQYGQKRASYDDLSNPKPKRFKRKNPLERTKLKRSTFKAPFKALGDDKIYCNLTPRDRNLVNLLFVQQMTGDRTNIDIFREAYNIPDEQYFKSKNMFSVRCSEKINSEKIQHCVKLIQNYHFQNSQAVVSKILREEDKIAFSNMGDYLNEDGSIKHKKQLSYKQTSAIKKYKTKYSPHTGELQTELELYDKGSALQRLEKVYGLEQNKLQLDINGNITQVTQNININANIDLNLLNNKTLRRLINILNDVQFETDFQLNEE